MIVASLADVDDGMAAGRVVCRCGGRLAPWGFARKRRVRGVEELVHPRRGRCCSCQTTHVLLPASCLVRRADSVQAIGQALEMAALGRGSRPIALLLGRPMETVRGWLRAVRRNAGWLIGLFTLLIVRLDPLASIVVPGSVSLIAGIVDMVGRLVAAGARAFTSRSQGPTMAVWQTVSIVTSGMLLSGLLPVVWSNTN